MPADNENRRNLSHHGFKEASGFATRSLHDANCVSGTDMPPPLRGDAPMSMTPHDAGFRRPVKIAPSSARPVGEPAAIKPPHDPGPHDHLDPRWRR